VRGGTFGDPFGLRSGQSVVSVVALSDRLDQLMPQSRTTPARTRRNTYTRYSIGCAAVWAVILVAAQRRTDSETRSAIRSFCVGWWSGWTSATIARVVYPPPKELTPAAAKRVGVLAIVLTAVGVISTVVVLIRGKRPAASAAGASGPAGVLVIVPR
jgi:hypothetical protein